MIDWSGYDAVLCDMDGTLIDTERLWLDAAADIIAAHDGPVPQASRYAGATAEQYLRLVATDIGYPGDPEDLRERFTTVLAEHYIAGGIRPLPGAIELLDRLTGLGVPLALVTSSDRAAVTIALGVLGRERFHAIVSADDVSRHKPDPEPYLAAASLLGARPSRCVAVEDSPTGVASAEAAGCSVIVVPNLVPIPPAPGRTVVMSLHEL